MRRDYRGVSGVMQNREGIVKAMLPAQRPEVERPDRMEEACGVFAVLAGEQPVANLAYFGLRLQHRGQGGQSLSSMPVKCVCTRTWALSVSLIKTLARMLGDLAIGHNRYSTTAAVASAMPSPLF